MTLKRGNTGVFQCVVTLSPSYICKIRMIVRETHLPAGGSFTIF